MNRSWDLIMAMEQDKLSLATFCECSLLTAEEQKLIQSCFPLLAITHEGDVYESNKESYTRFTVSMPGLVIQLAHMDF